MENNNSNSYLIGLGCLVVGLVAGLGGGYFYAKMAPVSKEAPATSKNQKATSTANPYAQVETNPYNNVKVNPFQ